MIVYVSNLQEMILALVGIAGEVDEKYLFSRFLNSILNQYSYTYAKRTIRSMCEQNMLNKKGYKDIDEKEKYLRLSKIAGDKAAADISEELLPHFSLMAGDANNRYKGTKNRLRRKKDTMHLALTHLLDGIMVDFITIEYDPQKEKGREENEYRKSVFDKNGMLLHPKDVIGKMEKEDLCYFTSGALRDIHNKAASVLKGNTQYCGLLMAYPKYYICYYIPRPDYTWSNTEEQLKLIVKSYVTSLYGDKTEPPAAIFYLEDEVMYDRYINPSQEDKVAKVRGKRINPPDIYERGYLLPLSGNYRSIREILLMEEGEARLSKVILEENYIPNKEYDGMVRGCKIFNLLLCDYCKMIRIRSEVIRDDAIILVHKWQEETAKKFFSSKTRMVVIDEDEFENYLLRLYESK